MKNNGVINSVSPIRDYEYSAINGSTEKNFPIEYTVKYTGAEIKDQGNYPFCVACALATVLEAWIQKIYGENIIISETFNFGALRKDALAINGMIHSEALKMQTEIGSVSKDIFDVVLGMPEIYNEIQKISGLFEEAKKWRFANYVKLNNGDTKTGRQKDLEIKDALTKYDVPLFAISPHHFGGSHAIAIIGWDDNSDSYIIKNSWGESYGDKGNAKIPKSEIREVYLLLYEPIKLPFTDVKEDDWFYDYVKQAYLSGIINGKTETTFEPNMNITRAEAATMISRLENKIDKAIEMMNDVLRMEIKYDKIK